MIAHRVNDVFAGLALFVLIATPSMKIFIDAGRELLNVVPLFLAVIALIGRNRIPIWSRRGSHVVLAFSFFFLALLASGFIPPGHLDWEALLKYTVLISVALVLPLASTVESIGLAFGFLYLWAIAIALTQLIVGIEFGENFHYLTVGLPVAAGALIALSRIFSGSEPSRILLHILGLALCGSALLSLPGRGPIVFPILIVLAFFVVRAVTSRSWKTKAAYGAILLLLAVGAYLMYLFIIPDAVARRIDRMIFSTLDEPRMSYLYLPAIEAILRNPLGYGLDGSYAILGYYPHNIFLEVLISLGIVGLVLFLPIVWILLASTCFLMKQRFSNPAYLALAFLSAFHFLFWNVSHPLSSGYALFTLMMVQGLLWARLRSTGHHDQRCHSNA